MNIDNIKLKTGLPTDQRTVPTWAWKSLAAALGLATLSKLSSVDIGSLVLFGCVWAFIIYVIAWVYRSHENTAYNRAFAQLQSISLVKDGRAYHGVNVRVIGYRYTFPGRFNPESVWLHCRDAQGEFVFRYIVENGTFAVEPSDKAKR